MLHSIRERKPKGKVIFVKCSLQPLEEMIFDDYFPFPGLHMSKFSFCCLSHPASPSSSTRLTLFHVYTEAQLPIVPCLIGQHPPSWQILSTELSSIRVLLPRGHPLSEWTRVHFTEKPRSHLMGGNTTSLGL